MASILIVDDNAANRILASKLLRTKGHQISEAEDGISAIEIAKRTQPDIVLLDLGLPGIDGWGTLDLIRADLDLRGLLVIAVTAHAMVGDRERAMEAGFDAYLSKPIDAATFADTVAGLLVGKMGSTS